MLPKVIKSFQHITRFIASRIILPASTGSVRSSSTDVKNTAHTNSGSLYRLIPGARIFRIVTRKLIAPSIDEIPDR